MGKKVTMPAVKMKARRAKKLIPLYHCTIPKVKPRKHTGVFDHNGDELDFTLELLSPYREVKSARIAELKKKYGKRSQRNPKRDKSPWYLLTKGVQYNYREKKYSGGSITSWFRRMSEQGLAHKSTIFEKMTKDKFAIQETKWLMKQWEESNPMPQKEIDGTKNMFYETEFTKWEEDRQNMWAETSARMHKAYKLEGHLWATTNKETNIFDVQPKLAYEKAA